LNAECQKDAQGPNPKVRLGIGGFGILSAFDIRPSAFIRLRLFASLPAPREARLTPWQAWDIVKFRVRMRSAAMTPVEVETYKKQLTALRDRLGVDVDHLTGEALNRGGDETGGNLSHLPIHMADLGTDNFEQENTLNLLAQERHLLDEINAALERIARGTFGRCEECHGPITPKARLKELPYTRYCFECASKLDQRK
jgi:DnaK suppressor protein